MLLNVLLATILGWHFTCIKVNNKLFNLLNVSKRSTCLLFFKRHLFFCSVVFGGYHEKLIYDKVLKNYDPLVRPIENDNDPVLVKLGMDLQQIIDIVSFYKNFYWGNNLFSHFYIETFSMKMLLFNSFVKSFSIFYQTFIPERAKPNPVA